MKKYIVLFVFLAAILIVVATSQKTTDRHHIRLGNRHFGKSQFDKAYIEYGKAISENPENSQAAYNMACVMTATENDSTLGQYQRAADMEHNPVRKAMSWHNIGVIMQTNHKYPEAIAAWKEHLLYNPSSVATYYNIANAYAYLLKDEEQGRAYYQQFVEKAAEVDKPTDKLTEMIEKAKEMLRVYELREKFKARKK